MIKANKHIGIFFDLKKNKIRKNNKKMKLNLMKK